MPPAKKRIIVDGDIYDGEEDPRYQELLRRRAQASRLSEAVPAGSSAAQHPPATRAPQHHQQQGGVFNFSAPAFKIVNPLPGQENILGLPDLEVYGARIKAVMVIGLGFLAYQFGWRGLVAAGVLWYVFSANAGVGAGPAQQPTPAAGPRAPAPPRPQQGQGVGAGGGAGAGGINDLFNNLGIGSAPAPSAQDNQQSGQRAGGSAGAPAPQQPAAGGSGAAGSAFSGRGHRLGGSS